MEKDTVLSCLFPDQVQLSTGAEFERVNRYVIAEVKPLHIPPATHRQMAALVVSGPRDPADCLRDLLQLPVQAENVMLKRPSLNDVFLQLTGRELRE